MSDHPIPASDLDEWLRRHMSEQPPRAYRLATRQRFEVAEEVTTALGGLDAELLGVHHDSGAVDFRIPPGARSAPGHVEGPLLQACRLADERSYRIRSAFPDQPYPTIEVDSSIPENGLDVIGPGGRAILVSDETGITGTMVIRRRDAPQEATGWRHPFGLIERLRRLEERAGGVDLYAEVGYFEASKRELQDWLRPALVVVAERPARDSEDVGWRQAYVEPVTHVEDLEPWTGLDLWYEAEGREDGE